MWATGSKALIDAATRQMKELPFYNAFFQTATPPAIELAELLAQVSAAAVPACVFRGFGFRGQRHRGAHGAALLGHPGPTGTSDHHRPQERLPRLHHGRRLIGGHELHACPRWAADPQHRAHRPALLASKTGKGMDRAAFGKLAASWLETKILEVGPEKVAAFIGEPVQGAGGVIVPPETYWPEIQRICDQYGILLVSDEVICGFRPHRPVVWLRDHGHPA